MKLSDTVVYVLCRTLGEPYRRYWKTLKNHTKCQKIWQKMKKILVQLKPISPQHIQNPGFRNPTTTADEGGIEDGLKHEKITIFVPPSFFF